MPTRLYSLVIDSADPSALARFWATATGWPITYEEADEVVVEPPEDDAGTPTEPGLPLVFVRVDDPKLSKNRVHIDLNSRSDDEQREIVE
ncbi:MAG TPA: VOC family protein, partial [Acidimicrobiales bacterium]|nr:VOC family protein [Acidimicrobiales bacterium]